MISHSVFDAGTALHDFDKGIKPSLVDVSLTLEQARSAYKELFDYDHRPVANPPDISHFKACCSTRGGFCKDDELIDRAIALTAICILPVVHGSLTSQFCLSSALAIGITS